MIEFTCHMYKYILATLQSDMSLCVAFSPQCIREWPMIHWFGFGFEDVLAVAQCGMAIQAGVTFFDFLLIAHGSGMVHWTIGLTP